MISSGLDCTVSLWDLRSTGKKMDTSPVATFDGKKSINSSYFSATGTYVVATTMNNKLEVLKDFHLSSVGKSKTPIVKPYHSISHDNHTGRWLSTFMATCHPYDDNIFAVGCMKHPRQVELFDSAGTGKKPRAVVTHEEHLTAVVSRLAFHPTSERCILAGGNSSGRVVIMESSI